MLLRLAQQPSFHHFLPLIQCIPLFDSPLPSPPFMVSFLTLHLSVRGMNKCEREGTILLQSVFCSIHNISWLIIQLEYWVVLLLSMYNKQKKALCYVGKKGKTLLFGLISSTITLINQINHSFKYSVLEKYWSWKVNAHSTFAIRNGILGFLLEEVKQRHLLLKS